MTTLFDPAAWEQVAEKVPMMKLMGQTVSALADGMAEITALPAASFENAQGRMHGGYVATLIDTAMGWAVQTKIGSGVGYGTIDLNVKFVRKIDVATGVLLAKAKVVHAGRTMLTAEARVEDAEGKLYAHGSGSFLVYPTK